MGEMGIYATECGTVRAGVGQVDSESQGLIRVSPYVMAFTTTRPSGMALYAYTVLATRPLGAGRFAATAPTDDGDPMTSGSMRRKTLIWVGGG